MKFSVAMILACCLFSLAFSLNVQDGRVLRFMDERLGHQSQCNPNAVPGLYKGMAAIFKMAKNAEQSSINDVVKEMGLSNDVTKTNPYSAAIKCFKESKKIKNCRKLAGWRNSMCNVFDGVWEQVQEVVKKGRKFY